jgi:conjugal transfer pilus assembly protein TraU
LTPLNTGVNQEIKMRRFITSFIFMLLGLFACGSVNAQSSGSSAKAMSLACNSYSPLETMFKDVCWSGMFPMRLMGATFKSGNSGIPADANKQVLCKCGGSLAQGKIPKIGFSIGFWAPSKIMDVTRRPYCLPSLGGTTLPLSAVDFMNTGANSGRGGGGDYFANWVLYSFPIIYMLRLIDDGACPADGMTEFDLLQMSPMFPNWNDVSGRYTTFMNPEMLLFTGVTSLFAYPVDAVASSAGHPINELFWVAGAWGGVYPITGFYGGDKKNSPDTVSFTNLIAVRGISLLHRLGMLNETIGSSNVCERHTRYIIRKDAYRWQFLAPSPETNGFPAGVTAKDTTTQVKEVNPPSRFSSCTHTTGSSSAAWGMWRDVPVTGEDHSYLLFQWTDCCLSFLGGGV